MMESVAFSGQELPLHSNWPVWQVVWLQQQQAHCWSASGSPFIGVSVLKLAYPRAPSLLSKDGGVGTGAQAQKRTPEETGRLEAQTAWAVNPAPAKGKCSSLSELLGSGIPGVQWENGPCLGPTPSFRPSHKISPLFS